MRGCFDCGCFVCVEMVIAGVGLLWYYCVVFTVVGVDALYGMFLGCGGLCYLFDCRLFRLVGGGLVVFGLFVAGLCLICGVDCLFRVQFDGGFDCLG